MNICLRRREFIATPRQRVLPVVGAVQDWLSLALTRD
jgi:hypothetical protein